MPTYKLTYFDAKGRAESTRLLFALADQKFEDVRHTHKEWPAIKHKYPMQQMPCLVVDNNPPLGQSRAINGFLARTFNLYGTNIEEATKIDFVLGIVDDLMMPIFLAYHQGKGLDDKDVRKDYYENQIPKFLEALECMREKCGGGDFFLGKTISLADVAFFAWADACRCCDVLKKYPKLYALSKSVEENPKIAKYLKNRPATID